MASSTFSSILGVTLGSLFYGTRFFVDLLSSDSQDKSRGSVSTENKINNHLKVAYEKIESWKTDNSINCTIILAFGENNSQTVTLTFSEIISKEYNEVFRRKLGSDFSKFERLAHDLVVEKIGLIDEVGNDTDYDYSQKIKDACKNNSSITLTFQEVSWDAKGKGEQQHFFWLPKDDKDIRTKVFNYLKRDLDTPFRKIKKWKDKNNIKCDIKLIVDSKETITVSEIEVDSRKYIGSSVFARDLEGKVKGTRLSKFEKFANDLTEAKIEVKDEVGDSAFFEYSKKIKDACSGNKPITLSFKSFTWKVGLDKKKATQKHSFWVPGDSKDEREQIFNYLDRDIETPIATIKKWKQKHNIDCPIEIRMQNQDYVSIDEISKNPNKYIGHTHFNKNIMSDGKRISLFQKLVEGLDKEVVITDKYGNKEIYDYVGKLKQVCKDKQKIKLVHYNKGWEYDKDAVNKNKQQLAYWFPADEKDENTMILNFLKWGQMPLLERLRKWEQDNKCEISLVLSRSSSIIGKISDILGRPHDFAEYEIFTKKLFIGENDEFSKSEVEGTKKMSQIEKLAKDITEGPIAMKDGNMQLKHYFLFEEIKKLCENNNNKVELSWRTLEWTKKYDSTNKVNHLHYFWHRESFNKHDAETNGSTEIHGQLRIIKTDIPTMSIQKLFPEYLEKYLSSFGITTKSSGKQHYYSPFDF